MTGYEVWFMIRRLREQGLTISAIARELGINRRTVRKALREDRVPEQNRVLRASPIDSFKPYVEERLKQYDLSAIRLLHEIRQKGYEGGYTTVKKFVAEIREHQVLKAVVRFETQPGGQGQVDWAEFGRVTIDGVEHKLSVFSFVLGYSRMKYCEFVIDTTTPSLIQCHLNAFAYFGGYTREILYDNMKQVVLERRERPDQIKWTPLFDDFAKHHEFLPRLCKPYHAWTKGKVENSVKFIRGNFFEGRTFTSLQDLNAQALAWCDVVNKRVHGTTKVPPIERFAHENLVPLAGKPAYVITQTFHRKISRECFVSYLGNRYSVPWKYADREAVLRVKQGRILVEVLGVLVAQHDIHHGTGNVTKQTEHFAGLLKATRDRIQQPNRVHDWTNVPNVEQRALSEYDRLLEDYPGA